MNVNMSTWIGNRRELQGKVVYKNQLLSYREPGGTPSGLSDRFEPQFGQSQAKGHAGAARAKKSTPTPVTGTQKNDKTKKPTRKNGKRMIYSTIFDFMRNPEKIGGIKAKAIANEAFRAVWDSKFVLPMEQHWLWASFDKVWNYPQADDTAGNSRQVLQAVENRLTTTDMRRAFVQVLGDFIAQPHHPMKDEDIVEWMKYIRANDSLNDPIVMRNSSAYFQHISDLEWRDELALELMKLNNNPGAHEAVMLHLDAVSQATAWDILKDSVAKPDIDASLRSIGLEKAFPGMPTLPKLEQYLADMEAVNRLKQDVTALGKENGPDPQDVQQVILQIRQISNQDTREDYVSSLRKDRKNQAAQTIADAYDAKYQKRVPRPVTTQKPASKPVELKPKVQWSTDDIKSFEKALLSAEESAEASDSPEGTV